MEDLSYKFCHEKDIQNHVFRDFVEAYAMVLARSDNIDLFASSLMAFPLPAFLGLFNNAFNLTWLPPPRLFKKYARAEARYQTNKFIEQFTMSVNRLEELTFPIHTLPLANLITNTRRSVDVLQGQVKDQIKSFHDQNNKARPYNSSWIAFWNAFWSAPKSAQLDQLQTYFDLSQRIDTHLVSVEEGITIFDLDILKMKRQNNQLREITKNVITDGPLTIPPSLQFSLQNISFLRPGSGLDHSYPYNFNIAFSPADLDLLRSELVRLCQGDMSINFTSDVLHLICVTMEELDNDILSNVHRSWVRERRKLIQRLEKSLGVDGESLIRQAKAFNHDRFRGKPVPG